jgi:phenylalanyl-tRNA synthetase alpha chain
MSGPNTDYDPVEVTPLKAEQVEAMREAALAAIESAGSLEELKQVRLDHAGDRSPLALANREIGALPPQARKEAGQRVGQARGAVNKALAARQVVLEEQHEARILVDEAVDVTLPWDRLPAGARHPVTTLSERIADVFVAMGWEVAEGPLVEAEWLNFDALNLGPDHPARTMQDTFWMDPVENAIVLRTHTSPVQARTMLTREPPIYVVCPGRVFRTDEYDATHSPVFHQVEGLVIDEGITMAHLKGSLDHFATSMFGEGITTRFRPSYFPFTEPSAEVDLVCFVCRGTGLDPAGSAAAEPTGSADEPAGSAAAEPTGSANQPCRTCKGEGWIEWGGCGVVNPRVLVACGVDPERYSGFAFGMGLDRTITGRYEIADLRDLFDGDVRFTEPFGVGL